MMKKLFLWGALALAFGQSANAQVKISCDTVIVDTLHYYFNKYYFKTGVTSYTAYPFFKSASITIATASNVTHLGSRFMNPSNNMTVTGLEAFCAKAAISAKSRIPTTRTWATLNSKA